MKIENLVEAEDEALKFIDKIHILRDKLTAEGNTALHTYIWGCKESGALRRSSMDLTRALAKMRNSK